jgi:hypothetical protein
VTVVGVFVRFRAPLHSAAFLINPELLYEESIHFLPKNLNRVLGCINSSAKLSETQLYSSFIKLGSK